MIWTEAKHIALASNNLMTMGFEVSIHFSPLPTYYEVQALFVHGVSWPFASWPESWIGARLFEYTLKPKRTESVLSS